MAAFSAAPAQGGEFRKLRKESESIESITPSVATICTRYDCSVLQRVAVCCSVLQCVAVCCSVLQCVAGFAIISASLAMGWQRQVAS